VQLLLDAKLLLLIGVANGTPILSRRFFGGRFTVPVDGGVRLPDGEPLLGHSKSLRGIVSSVLVTTVVARLVGLGWFVGALIGVMAMAGDLMSSFLKRRLRLAPSSMAIGIDQVPESLFPLLVCITLLALRTIDVAAIVLAFLIVELVLSRLLFRLHVRDRPY
jgi:CDP-2,3-bis-(O-geranylgeranyl)-sn-glycerol synthase